MTKILVVDDSTTQREYISSLLKQRGYTVAIARNGEEAIALVSKYAFDLVVLDVVMPGMNGYEVCRKIKGDPNTKKVPVVMCSTKDQEFDRVWGMRQGADAYIVKPFDPPELISTVRQLLKG